MTFDSKGELWPVLPFGFEPDDGAQNGGGDGNGNQQSNNDGGQGNSQQNQQGNQQQQNNQQQNDGDDGDDEYEGLSAKELRRIARDNAARAASAETERDTAKNKLTEEERKKLDKDQQKDLRITDLESENAKLKATNTKLALIGAIRDDVRFTWHNPEMVAGQLDSEKVKVTDDGKVEGLAPLLGKIAKDESLKFMLKSDNTQQNNGNQQQQNGNQQQNNGQQTGLQPGQGGANQGGSMPPNAAELAELMPALRNRM